LWREDRVDRLLAREDGEVPFVAGCASNQGTFDLGIETTATLATVVGRLLDLALRSAPG
jgi:hypothetical protein